MWTRAVRDPRWSVLSVVIFSGLAAGSASAGFGTIRLDADVSNSLARTGDTQSGTAAPFQLLVTDSADAVGVAPFDPIFDDATGELEGRYTELFDDGTTASALVTSGFQLFGSATGALTLSGAHRTSAYFNAFDPASNPSSVEHSRQLAVTRWDVWVDSPFVLSGFAIGQYEYTARGDLAIDGLISLVVLVNGERVFEVSDQLDRQTGETEGGFLLNGGFLEEFDAGGRQFDAGRVSVFSIVESDASTVSIPLGETSLIGGLEMDYGLNIATVPVPGAVGMLLSFGAMVSRRRR